MLIFASLKMRQDFSDKDKEERKKGERERKKEENVWLENLLTCSG